MNLFFIRHGDSFYAVLENGVWVKNHSVWTF